MKDDYLIEVNNLKVYFPLKDNTVKAVDDVSWNIKKGETLAVVGESGSGKSVTAMSLMRLTDYSGGDIVSGSINFNRKNGDTLDITQQNQDTMREIRGNDISMIFQEPMTSLNPVFTIGMQISEAIIKHQNKTPEEAREISLEMLKLVRIPEPEKQLEQYPHQLSGGMRQRVMIAMALSCKPSLLIADEPTTALDVTIQAQILDLIKMLQRDIGMSVMFITHDMGVVAEVADRVVVMLNGKKVEEGTAKEIFLKPKHPYTKALLSAVPKLGSMKGRRLPAKFANIDVKRAEGDEVKDIKDGHQLQDIKDQVNYKSPPLLKVEGLTTRFEIKQGMGGKKGIVHAVQNIDFSMQPGETFGLVGESGCGKSTLLRWINRMNDTVVGARAQGQLTMGELDILARSTDVVELRRHIGIVFQKPNPFPKSIYDNVAFGPRLHFKLSKSELDDLVEWALRKAAVWDEVKDRLKAPALGLSGGQQQRLCIARAIAVGPKILLMDEPCSALDPQSTLSVEDLIFELREQYTIVIVTHNMQQAVRVSDMTAFFNAEAVEGGTGKVGYLVEFNDTDKIFNAPQQQATQEYVSGRFG